LIPSIGELIEALDDPRGESGKFNFDDASPRKSLGSVDRSTFTTPPRMKSVLLPSLPPHHTLDLNFCNLHLQDPISHQLLI
jgi:hypothetical protein